MSVVKQSLFLIRICVCDHFWFHLNKRHALGNRCTIYVFSPIFLYIILYFLLLLLLYRVFYYIPPTLKGMGEESIPFDAMYRY